MEKKKKTPPAPRVKGKDIWHYEEVKDEILKKYADAGIELTGKYRLGFFRKRLSKGGINIREDVLYRFLRGICEEGYLIKTKKLYNLNPDFTWAVVNAGIKSKLEKISGDNIISKGLTTFYGLPNSLLKKLPEGKKKTLENELEEVNKEIIVLGERLHKLKQDVFITLLRNELNTITQTKFHPDFVVNELTKRVLFTASFQPYYDTKIDLKSLTDNELLVFGSNLPTMYQPKEIKQIFKKVRKCVNKNEGLYEEVNQRIKGLLEQLEELKGVLFVYDGYFPSNRHEEHRDLLTKIASRTGETKTKVEIITGSPEYMVKNFLDLHKKLLGEEVIKEGLKEAEEIKKKFKEIQAGTWKGTGVKPITGEELLRMDIQKEEKPKTPKIPELHTKINLEIERQVVLFKASDEISGWLDENNEKYIIKLPEKSKRPQYVSVKKLEKL
ncbi:MAG: hypothetical protein L6265_05890 [Thermoplasmatales archaeon]|nr:hypothetical protein [Thermoplasmatales archaeon]